MQLIEAGVLLWWSWRDPMPTLVHYRVKLLRAATKKYVARSAYVGYE